MGLVRWKQDAHLFHQVINFLFFKHTKHIYFNIYLYSVYIHYSDYTHISPLFHPPSLHLYIECIRPVYKYKSCKSCIPARTNMPVSPGKGRHFGGRGPAGVGIFLWQNRTKVCHGGKYTGRFYHRRRAVLIRGLF